VSVHVLVVDDDYDMRETIADTLQDEGLIVATAGDGLEALAYLRAEPPPRVILLEWMMPRCDGSQFRAEQLRDPALANIPVVMLSADRRREHGSQQLGIETFLAKPCNRETLLAAIRKYC
jgi:CheY-like chemotaxis protein